MTDGRDPTAAETTCFEAGIKFGSLYHQFAGTPVSPDSADSLADAIEDAIGNQPGCVDVRVTMREDRLREAIADAAADYVEFTGEFAEVEVVVEDGGVEVLARMDVVDGYPLMRVERVRE